MTGRDLRDAAIGALALVVYVCCIAYALHLALVDELGASVLAFLAAALAVLVGDALIGRGGSGGVHRGSDRRNVGVASQGRGASVRAGRRVGDSSGDGDRWVGRVRRVGR